jgi:hypothetical protein
MHLQRAALLIAIVLGLTALAASLAPSRQSGNQTSQTQQPPPPPPPVAPAPTARLTFRAPPGRRAQVVKARAGDHVVVDVASSTPGEASIPELGLSGSAEPKTPASFDVIVPQAGQRYAVMFAPPSGAPSTIGTLVATG